MDRFTISFDRVIGHEGGYTNDRRDRGNWSSGVIGVGELKGTKFGISAMSYPKLDIRNLTVNDARIIYRRDFWTKFKCDQMPVGIDYLLFDTAINSGIGNAAKILQRAVGTTADGAIGPKTIAAVKAKRLPDLIDEFCAQRMLFYTGISTFQTYKTGWTRRAFTTHAQALKDIL